jgi:hypothetical protein
MSGYLRPAAVNFLDEDGDVDLLAFKIAKENHKRKKEEKLCITCIVYLIID